MNEITTMVEFKTSSDPHQLAALDFCAQREAVALLMEQGTGKSKVTIDRAFLLHRSGAIDALLVVAPNGVHADWIREQFAEHWSGAHPAICEWWRSGGGKRHERAVEALMLPGPPASPLRVLAMNVEALRTKRGEAAATRFVRSGRALMAFDESSLIKTPSAAQTRAAWRVGKLARFRMILTGTEITNSPLDVYAQFQFLRPGLLGHQNFATFKARYADWEQRVVRRGERLQEYPALLRYRNLEELRSNIRAHSFMVRRKDCLTLPPQIYERRSVVLTTAQRNAYDVVRERVLAELSQGTLTTANLLTKALRLSQIAGGFLPLDNTAPDSVTPLPNAKLEALEGIIDGMAADEGAIIWARFRAELEAIYALLSARAPTARWWGGVDSREQEAAEFKLKQRRFMVAQQRAGGKGHTWLHGTTVIYFSNSFSYEDRKQSEDRSHRRGQTADRVLYIDLVALDTVDERVLAALKAKKDLADFFKGSPEAIVQ
jgi:hypothetical protein